MSGNFYNEWDSNTRQVDAFHGAVEKGFWGNITPAPLTLSKNHHMNSMIGASTLPPQGVYTTDVDIELTPAMRGLNGYTAGNANPYMTPTKWVLVAAVAYWYFVYRR